MNDYLEKYKQWWSGLGERERKMLSFGAAFVALALFYLIIWSPYLAKVDALRNQIQAQKKTLAAMQATDKEIRQLENESVPVSKITSTVELLSYLQNQLEESGLDGGQLKQSADDSVQMQFQKVEFDKLIGLLVKIAKEQAISISQMSVVADKTPGIVNANMIIKL